MNDQYDVNNHPEDDSQEHVPIHDSQKKDGSRSWIVVIWLIGIIAILSGIGWALSHMWSDVNGRLAFWDQASHILPTKTGQTAKHVQSKSELEKELVALLQSFLNHKQGKVLLEDAQRWALLKMLGDKGHTLLAQTPGHPVALRALCFSELQYSAPRKSTLRFCEDASDEYPSDSDLLHILGHTYVYFERYNECISIYDILSDLNPMDVSAYALQGRCEIAIRQFESAIKNLDHALAIDATHQNALYSKCMGLTQWDHHAEALIACQNAIDAYPNDPVAYELLSHVHEKSQNWGDGIRTINRAIALNPNNYDYYQSLGHMHINKSEYTFAVEAYKQALALHPDDFVILFELGRSYSGLNQLDDAMKYYLKALALDKEHPMLLNNIGSVYYRMKIYAMAMVNLKQAHNLAPEFVLPVYNLGLVYKDMGDIEKATAQLTALRKLAPDSKYVQSLHDYLNAQ